MGLYVLPVQSHRIVIHDVMNHTKTLRVSPDDRLMLLDSCSTQSRGRFCRSFPASSAALTSGTTSDFKFLCDGQPFAGWSRPAKVTISSFRFTGLSFYFVPWFYKLARTCLGRLRVDNLVKRALYRANFSTDQENVRSTLGGLRICNRSSILSGLRGLE